MEPLVNTTSSKPQNTDYTKYPINYDHRPTCGKYLEIKNLKFISKLA